MKSSLNNPEEHLTGFSESFPVLKTAKNSHPPIMKLVYVVNQDGSKLMPCKPAKARKLLKSGKARVIRRNPFTIKLNWQCEGITQVATLGLDKGSHKTGFSVVGNGKVLICGEIHHRKDIREKMDSRREHRRSRRSRKWYRKRRFDNRSSSKRSGRIPPSVKANAEEVIRTVNKLPVPISHITVEDVQVDVAKLNNPDWQGKAYQKSNRLDENLRIACLMRDNYTCRVCGKRNVRLEAHHITLASQGGKDTIKNLITLCDKCHDKVHQGKITLNIAGENGFRDRISQRTMQGKAYLYEELSKIASVSKIFGYQTSEYRKFLGLEKTHSHDALCVATFLCGEIVEPNEDNFYTVSFLPRQTRKRYKDLPQKGKGRVKCQVNEELEGFQKGDVVLVKGRWKKRVWSIYSNGYMAFPRVKGEPCAALPQHCRLLGACRRERNRPNFQAFLGP